MFKLFSCILLTVFVFSIYCKDDVPKKMGALDNARELYRNSDYKGVLKVVGRILKDRKLANSERTPFLFLQAKCYAHLKQEKELNKLLVILSEITRNEEIILEQGELRLIMGDFASATDYAKQLASMNSLYYKAKSEYLRARSEFAQKQYLKSVNYCDEYPKTAMAAVAEAEKKAMTSDIEFARGLYTDLESVRMLRIQAWEAWLIEHYGIDYFHYRKGRSAQFDGKWKDAIAEYGKIVLPGVLRDAALYYSAKSMASAANDTKICAEPGKKCKTQPWKHALVLYEEILVNNPDGLYSEEALLDLTELTYRYGFSDADTQKSLEYLERFFVLLERIKTNDPAKPHLDGLNENVKNDFIKTNPQQFVVQNDVGQLVRTLKRSESIINRITAPWYLLEKETRAWLLKGFLLGELGDKISASKAYQKAWELGGGKILCSEDALNRLLAGLCDSSYLLPKNIKMNKLKKEARFLLPLAAFYFITEREKEAGEVFDALKKDYSRFISDYEQFTIDLVQAQYLYKTGKQKDTRKLLESIYVNKKAKRLPHWYMTAYLYANFLAGNGAKGKAYEVYQEIIKKATKKSEYSPLSMLAYAVYATNCGDRETALDVSSRLRGRYSKTPYRDAAKTLRTAVKKASEGEFIAIKFTKEDTVDEDDSEMKNPDNKKDEKDDYEPRIFEVNQVLVIPDSKKWNENLPPMKSGDLVLYNARFLSRDVCTIIRGASVQYPLDEPQIPSTKTNLLTYIRVPYLFDKSLRYDFKNAFLEKKKGLSNEDTAVDENGELIDSEPETETP